MESYLNPKVTLVYRNTIKSDILRMFMKKKSMLKKSWKIFQVGCLLTSDLRILVLQGIMLIQNEVKEQNFQLLLFARGSYWIWVV